MKLNEKALLEAWGTTREDTITHMRVIILAYLAALPPPDMDAAVEAAVAEYEGADWPEEFDVDGKMLLRGNMRAALIAARKAGG